MMAFVGSVDYVAAGQVSITLPVIVDASGNAGFSQGLYSHMRVVPASSAVSVTTVFDSKPAVVYSTVGSPDVWAIPVTARSAVVTPTGGSATVELGKD
jgi:hypothetical protein